MCLPVLVSMSGAPQGSISGPLRFACKRFSVDFPTVQLACNPSPYVFLCTHCYVLVISIISISADVKPNPTLIFP